MDAIYRVLVVDDNPTNRAILVKSLQKAGHEVLSAEDGESAITIAVAERPDVILLDMILPAADGLQVCQILKSKDETAPIPIIFVTAVSKANEILRAFQVGGSDYVTKPFRTAEILARVSVHARLRRAEDSLLAKNRQTEKLAQDLAEANVQLARLSRTDPLTGLLNRRAWKEAAMQEHDRFLRCQSPYGVIILDVDHFKAFNDSCGHQAGDDCLKRVAEAIRGTCRSSEVVGRYGGEEFVVLTSDCTRDAALNLAERIRKTIWSLGVPHPASSTADRVTACVGVATIETGSWEDVLKRADDALYVAKRSGRNMVYAEEHVTIPKNPPPPRETAQPITPIENPAASNATILIVDDNPTNRTLCQRCLDGEGYQSIQAGNGQEALDLVERHMPSVILMDVAMPNVDGLECTRRLRANAATRDIPIIMISARTDGPDVLAGLKAGADEYLTKPIRTQELSVRVRSMVRLHRERADLLRSYQMRGEQTRILKSILECSSAITSATNGDEILEYTLSLAAQTTGCKRISIMLPDAENRVLTIAQAIGMDPQTLRTVVVPIGQTVAGKVFATHEPIVINSVSEAEFTNERYDTPYFASVPLVSAPMGRLGHTVGVLNLTERPNGRPFDSQDLEYIYLVANIAGSALHGLTSYKAVDRARDSIMIALAKLAEHRDRETNEHVERVTRYCRYLADYLRREQEVGEQINDAFLRDLERAVPLHDIGKVAIPDAILLKPGRLTDDEMAIMRTHAEIGAETIRSVIQRTPGVTFLDMAADIAHAHHEWYDGSGYPRHLQGSEIPLAARIAALADVYDALTTKRVYKDRIPHEQAVTIITEYSGRQFDPLVVEAFLEREAEFAAFCASSEEPVATISPSGSLCGVPREPDAMTGRPA